MADQDEPGLVTLPRNMDAPVAADLKTELLALRGRPVRIDGAAVERFGGLCLQVLLAATQTWAEDGQACRIEGASPALEQAVRRFGASALLTISHED